MASERPAARAATLGRLMSVNLQSLRSRIPGRGRAKADPPSDPVPVPSPRWDNVGLAVDRAIDTFLSATDGISGIARIDAKSSGPVVHFLVSVDGNWDAVIRDIEARLYPLAQAGELPIFDYDVQMRDEPIGPGYLPILTG